MHVIVAANEYKLANPRRFGSFNLTYVASRAARLHGLSAEGETSAERPRPTAYSGARGSVAALESDSTRHLRAAGNLPVGQRTPSVFSMRAPLSEHKIGDPEIGRVNYEDLAIFD